MIGFPSMAGHGGMSAGYPSGGGGGVSGPGGPAPPNARGGPAGGTNPSYFTDKKKGEVNELKNVSGSAIMGMNERGGAHTACLCVYSCCAR